jgi:5-methylcytosine-specific restriction endonuclease McrA
MGDPIRRARTALSYELQVRVFRRDLWICRWCHRPVVFAPALKFVDGLVRERGHKGPLAYHEPRWRRDRAPLLDHLGAVVDHVEAFARGGAHDESNFVTACNKCNARKNKRGVDAFQQAVPSRAVKGKYGEPQHWDGFSTLFVVLAQGRIDLTPSERGWLVALSRT